MCYISVWYININVFHSLFSHLSVEGYEICILSFMIMIITCLHDYANNKPYYHGSVFPPKNNCAKIIFSQFWSKFSFIVCWSLRLMIKRLSFRMPLFMGSATIIVLLEVPIITFFFQRCILYVVFHWLVVVWCLLLNLIICTIRLC